MKTITFILFVLILTSTKLRAEIWTTQNDWNSHYEHQYVRWYQDNFVHLKILTSKQSPYYGIHTESINIQYALRAIFAKKHRLPFKVKNPIGSKSNRYIDNESNFFDSAGDPNRRLVALINYLSQTTKGKHTVTLFTSSRLP